MSPLPSRPAAEGSFLPGAAGPVFILYHSTGPDIAHRGDVIVVPPFAEEMNKSRRMFALLAARLASAGVGTLVLDLFGTGDSAGDFSAARYEIWIDDIGRALAWLRRRTVAPVALVGLRFGGLLAADFARRYPDAVDQLVLWQPVVSGESTVTQFLRLRVAAAMMSNQEGKESTAALRARLAAGEALEVGGYMLVPELAAAIDALQLEPLVTAQCPAVAWLELGSGDLAPVSKRVCAAWHARGVPVHAVSVPGPAFWSSVEIAVAPSLIEQTLETWLQKAAA